MGSKSNGPKTTMNLSESLARRGSSPGRKLSTGAANSGHSGHSGHGDGPGLSVLSALNLLRWKNNSVKPKMLGFKELKRKKKDDNSPSKSPMNNNVFQLREHFTTQWY